MTFTVASELTRVLGEACAAGKCTVVGDTVARLDGVFAEVGDRAIEVPSSDRAAVGVALGMALGGQRAIVDVPDAGRMWSMMEVLAEASAIASSGEFALPLVIRVPCGGEAGVPFDAQIVEALLSLPGLQVWAPSTPDALLGVWALALTTRSPMVIMEPRRLWNRVAESPLTCDSAGVARVLRSGRDVVLLASGTATSSALEAADALAGDGIEATVVDVISLNPVQRQGLVEVLQSVGRVLIVEPAQGGFVARALQIVLDEAFLFLESPPTCVRVGEADIRLAALEAVDY